MKILFDSMIRFCLLVSLCVPVCTRFIHKIEDFGKPMPQLVAECRKGCLMKFLPETTNDNVEVDCSKRSSCFMCWDYCSLMFKDRKKKIVTRLMCTDRVCFAGCKFACNYYQYLLAKPMHRPDDFF